MDSLVCKAQKALLVNQEDQEEMASPDYQVCLVNLVSQVFRGSLEGKALKEHQGLMVTKVTMVNPGNVGWMVQMVSLWGPGHVGWLDHKVFQVNPERMEELGHGRLNYI
ncbi:hypothetical protein BSL78_20649 [Apostichopus japonicus]|uniref:Uncharacterized protein n=1 Tax=Stichopus japonicus TaxID=307972 RepID=A0A2G8K3G0_STIJA|nr:hypothetical protein BSL78_20649 [Apostichopus japonicus]